MSKTKKPILDKEILEARHILWHKGILSWKLNSFQKGIVEHLRQNPSNLPVILSSRRSGKSYYLTVVAIEQCIQNPGSIVKILQPEQKMVRMNLKPIMQKILEDCPAELMPSFKTQDNIYVFPNKSEIHLAGSDNGNNEKLRGSDCHLAIVDEAGFCDDLAYTINSILMPMTLITKGKIVLSSTPPKQSDHDFIEYLQQAEIKGNLVKHTIFDVRDACAQDENPTVTDAEIDRILESYPRGVESKDFRREYLAEILKDDDRSVIPEADDALMGEIVNVWPKPKFCDKYVAMDVGFKDLTVVLFAYYDFENAVTVVEDEVVMNGYKMTLESLATSIKAKEEELWTDRLTGEQAAPFKRVSDNNLIVINDLKQKYGVTFTATQKDNKEAALNSLRVDLNAGRVSINPKCKTLIYHLKNAEWNKARTSFSRSIDSGHYDAVDAMIYLIRNINKNKNPYPKGYNKLTGPDVFDNPFSEKSDNKWGNLADALMGRLNKR